MLAAAGSHLCYHVEPLSGMEDSTTENRLVLFEKMDRAVPEAGPVADEGQGANVPVGS